MSSTYDWVLVVYLMSSIALPFLLYNRALRQLPMGVASLMIILTIPLGCILSWLTERTTTPPLLLGGSLVVLGALIPQIRGFRSKGLLYNPRSHLVKAFLFQDRISASPEFQGC